MPSNKFKTKFPPARIKKIMQTDEEVGKVAAAVPVIVSKSLELFTEIFLQKCGAIATSRGARTLSMDHIKECVDSEQKFDFLREIVAEAAAKAVGKSGEDAAAPQPPPALQPDPVSNGAKETKRRMVKIELTNLRERKKAISDPVKPERPANPSGTSLTVPPLSQALLSNLKPSPGGSSSAVIAKIYRSPVVEKRTVKREVRDMNDADDETERTETRIRQRKQSRLHSVVDGLTSGSESSLPAKETATKPPPALSRNLASSDKKSGPLSSVIVKRDIQRSQSHSERHRPGPAPYSHPESSNSHPKPIPSSAPPVIPTTMHFMYGGGTATPLYPQSVPAYNPPPSSVESFPYTPQAMMMMMQQQQDAREALQYQMYAQHEQQQQQQRLVEESRLPTYPSPRDYFAEAAAARSVIVPTAEAQDLRMNRPVGSSSAANGHQRFPSYHDMDGPY